MRDIRKAIIPVAGLGTRFLPATKAQPKEMLPLVDKPVIQYVVEEAGDSGISNVVFVTGRGKQAIENHFDVSYELERILAAKGKHDQLKQITSIHEVMQFTYVRQGDALGLGHAIRCASFVANDEPVAVLLGDDVFFGDTPALGDLIKVYAETGMAVVGVQRVPREHVSRYGVVSAGSGARAAWQIDLIVEKPDIERAPSDFAVIGRYILTPEVFDILETIPLGHGGEFQLTDALTVMADRGRLMAVELRQRHFDTGNKLDYMKACMEFGLQRPEFHLELQKYILEKAADLSSHNMY